MEQFEVYKHFFNKVNQKFTLIFSQKFKMPTIVYVGGLNYSATEKDIKRFFHKFGRIGEVFLKSGFCFVKFDDLKDAFDACNELNGRNLLGDRVKVEIARGFGRKREKKGATSISDSKGRGDH